VKPKRRAALAGVAASVLVAVAWDGSGTASRADSRIAFVSSGSLDSGADLYLVNADGTGRRQLTQGGALVNPSQPYLPPARPSWSPDGKQLAFQISSETEQPKIALVRVGGGNIRVVVRNASYPAWSPNGDLILFDRERFPTTDLWTIRIDGTHARLLVRNAASGAWSPDGTRIAFTRVGRRAADFKIYALRLDSGAQQEVTRGPGIDVLPAWAPGNRIAFARMAKYPTDASIFVINTDGTGERLLTRHGGSPAWSPDGRRLAFHGGGTVGGWLFVINADGSERRQLTHTIWDVAPAWEPG
jgi:Tol biopolymer transport system component